MGHLLLVKKREAPAIHTQHASMRVCTTRSKRKGISAVRLHHEDENRVGSVRILDESKYKEGKTQSRTKPNY